MTGVLDPPRERGVVRGGPGSVVGNCDEPGVSGDSSSNDGSTGCKNVANGAIRAIVGS